MHKLKREFMTESEWLTCMNPLPLLDAVWQRASERKLRLFAVACCRRIFPLFSDERSRRAVEIAERYADGKASKEELREAEFAARSAAATAGSPLANSAEGIPQMGTQESVMETWKESISSDAAEAAWHLANTTGMESWHDGEGVIRGSTPAMIAAESSSVVAARACFCDRGCRRGTRGI